MPEIPVLLTNSAYSLTLFPAQKCLFLRVPNCVTLWRCITRVHYHLGWRTEIHVQIIMTYMTVVVYVQCYCDGSHFSYDTVCQFSFGILLGGRSLGIAHVYCCCGCFPRKSPGGVFLTLVKTCATAEQKKEIFQVDKEITARRVKKEKKRKANERWRKERQRELEVVKQKAEWELRIFRAQLGDDFEAERTLNTERTNSSSCTAEEGLVQSEENGILSTPLTSKSKSSDKGETMEVEASGLPDFNNRGRSHQQQHRLKEKKVALAEERLAAEEFERMNEYDLDFGIDLA